MNASVVERLFELPKRGKYVPDYFAGVLHGDHDEETIKMLRHFFVEAEAGDVVCVILLRDKTKKPVNGKPIVGLPQTTSGEWCGVWAKDEEAK